MLIIDDMITEDEFPTKEIDRIVLVVLIIEELVIVVE